MSENEQPKSEALVAAEQRLADALDDLQCLSTFVASDTPQVFREWWECEACGASGGSAGIDRPWGPATEEDPIEGAAPCCESPQVQTSTDWQSAAEVMLMRLEAIKHLEQAVREVRASLVMVARVTPGDGQRVIVEPGKRPRVAPRRKTERSSLPALFGWEVIGQALGVSAQAAQQQHERSI